jgi:YCII-related domain-containing protein
MPQFVLLYIDAVPDADQPEPTEERIPEIGDTEEDGVEAVSDPEADAAADMREWMAWSERIGDALVDFGHPLGNGRAVTAARSRDITGDANSVVGGYSIIEADDIEAATDLVQGHPHLDTGTIEIYEEFELPGM